MIENSHIRLVSPIGSLYREEGEGEEGREEGEGEGEEGREEGEGEGEERREEGEGEEGSEMRQLSTSSPAAGVRKFNMAENNSK